MSPQEKKMAILGEDMKREKFLEQQDLESRFF